MSKKRKPVAQVRKERFSAALAHIRALTNLDNREEVNKAIDELIMASVPAFQNDSGII